MTTSRAYQQQDLETIQALVSQMDKADPKLIRLESKIEEKPIEIVRNPLTNEFYLLKQENLLGQGSDGSAYLAYRIISQDKGIHIAEEPIVIKRIDKKLGEDEGIENVKNEISGLASLYTNVGFAETDISYYLFIPYLSGKPLIKDQRLAVEKLEGHADIEKLSFKERVTASAEIATQLYRVHHSFPQKNLPHRTNSRMHGDVKGSNFHFHKDEKGVIKVYLLDFGTSKEVTMHEGKPVPIPMNSYIGSFGHITKNMIQGDDKKMVFAKSINDDIHNAVPLMGFLLGQPNPYIDKAKAVYAVAIQNIMNKYDIQLVNDLKNLPKFEKTTFLIHKNEQGQYEVLTYNPKMSGLVKRGKNLRVFPLTLNEAILAELDSGQKLSDTTKNTLFSKIFEFTKEASFEDERFHLSEYRAEAAVPYRLNQMYKNDFSKNWSGTEEYTEQFLKRMQGVDHKTEQANSLETRLFWGALQNFCEKNEEKAKSEPVKLDQYKTLFDFLMTDQLQKSDKQDIKDLRKILQQFYAYIDQITPPEKARAETALFWEIVNEFFNAHEHNLSTSVSLAKLSVLSKSHAKAIWGDLEKPDYKKHENQDLNNLIITLATRKDDISYQALCRLLTCEPKIRDAIIELYSFRLSDKVMDSALLLLLSSPRESAVFADKILNTQQLDLRSISVESFSKVYKEFADPKSHRSSIFSRSKSSPSFLKLNKKEKQILAELNENMMGAKNDFERFKVLKNFIDKNNGSIIAQKMQPLVDAVKDQIIVKKDFGFDPDLKMIP